MPKPEVEVGQDGLKQGGSDQHCETGDQKPVDRLLGLKFVCQWFERTFLELGNPVRNIAFFKCIPYRTINSNTTSIIFASL